MDEVDKAALANLTDRDTRKEIERRVREDFGTNLDALVRQVSSRGTIRNKLESNRTSFDKIMELSRLGWKMIGPTTGFAMLGGFLYMAIHKSVRQAQAGSSEGHTEECFQLIIDKLRRCNGASAALCSTCADSQMPEDHVKDRLAEAYRVLINLLGTIVESLETPLDSMQDQRWDKIRLAEENYHQFMQESDSCLLKLLDNSRSASASANTVFTHVLPKELPRFFSRDDEMRKIRESLATCRSLTLRGIAGVGKTSLALHYAYSSLSKYSTILWMRCEPESALDQSCYQALQRLGVLGSTQQQVVENRRVWRDLLAQAAFNWLVIFDNVESAVSLDQFWPSGDRGKIIVTTQKPEVGYQLTQDEIPVLPFTTEQGRECITRLASWSGGVPSDPESAEELNEELGGLPLGISHMTALMRARKTSVKTFLRDYRRHKSRYHGKDFSGVIGVHPKEHQKIATNWKIAFEAINADARALLGVLSFLAPSDIPQDLFKHWDEGENRSTSGLLSFCSLSDDFLDVEEELMNHALIDKDPSTEMLSLHRLEQEQFIYYLGPSSRQEAFDQTAKLLCDIFPKEHVGQRFTGRWDDCHVYMQHAIKLNFHYLSRDPDNIHLRACPEFATLMAWCTWFLWEIADFTNFKKALSGGMEACKSLSNINHATLSMLHYNAGTVETGMGLFEKAEASLLKALRYRESANPVNEDELAATHNNLGMLYNSLHKFDIAEQHYAAAVKIHQARADTRDRNLSMAMSKHNLQRNAIQSGKLPSPQELQATVDFFEQTISWWMTAHSYLVLGNGFFKLHRYNEATSAYDTARAILSEPGRAERQPATAIMIYKLGLVALETSHFDKAADYFRESIQISKLYVDIPAEQARTQFMLVNAIRRGACEIRKGEKSDAQEAVRTLIAAHYKAVGQPMKPVPTKVEDYDKFITAKYQ